MILRDKILFEPPEIGCVLSLTGLPGGGSRIYDRSPYGNIGTITGATWKRLPSGLWCLSLDGNDDSIGIPNVASLQVTGDMTILAWVNLADTSDAIIVAKHYAREYEFWACRGGDELALYHGDGAYELGNSGGADISSHVGEWILAGVTRTADPKKVKFYLNGSYISDWDYAKTVVSGTNTVLIGQRIGNNYVLEGYLALPRIWGTGSPLFKFKQGIHAI